MLNKLKYWSRGKIYVIPSLYAFVFAVVSILLLKFDQFIYENLIDTFSTVQWNSDNVGIYTLVSSSLITMTTITFSIMMVVLTLYGSQLSSRSLQDFLGKKITLRILGYYIGSLVFVLIQLGFQQKDELSSGVSSIICIFLLLIGVVIFVYFIHFISKSIQITLYIDDIVLETLGLLEKSKEYVYSSVHIQGGDSREYEKSLVGDYYELKTKKTGYLQYYDTKKLVDLTTRYNIRLQCDVMIGEFLTPDETVAKIYGFYDIHNDEEITDEILQCINLGDESDLFRDISTGTKRLIDVALRALSPGINDPTTAISCIKKIGYLLSEIAKGLEVNVFMDDNNEVRVMIRSLSFDRLLFNHFYQIKKYATTDVFVLESIVSALISISKECNSQIKKQIWEFSKYLFEDIDISSFHIVEQRILMERQYQLAQIVNVDYNFKR